MSQEEIELAFRSPKPNWPGHSAPLEMKHLKTTDAAILTPIFKKYGKQIRTYLGHFHNAHAWQMGSAQSFVMDAINREFPSYTWTFWIGNKVVGLASLEPYGESVHDVQIVLFVVKDFEGKGLATAIGNSLKYFAFRIMGFSSFWWLVDESNIGSIRAAEKNGLDLHHTWTDEVKHSEKETGEWRAYWQPRPEGLEDGVLQGASLSYWQETRTSSLLQAVIEAKKNKEALEGELLREINGVDQAKAQVEAEKNIWERALEERNAQMKKDAQKILNETMRKAYNQSLGKRNRK
jgi:RimJ/RimL family protein N-acetyltransferase